MHLWTSFFALSMIQSGDRCPLISLLLVMVSSLLLAPRCLFALYSNSPLLQSSLWVGLLNCDGFLYCVKVIQNALEKYVPNVVIVWRWLFPWSRFGNFLEPTQNFVTEFWREAFGGRLEKTLQDDKMGCIEDNHIIKLQVISLFLFVYIDSNHDTMKILFCCIRCKEERLGWRVSE